VQIPHLQGLAADVELRCVLQDGSKCIKLIFKGHLQRSVSPGHKLRDSRIYENMELRVSLQGKV
jgi:hypothetical protein